MKDTHPLNIVIVGHVDHGKSTLIGRLLYDTGSLPDGKYEELQQICQRRGTDVLEWSFVLDAFQAERDQAITIDTTQIRFATQKRNYVIIDAPGHREFLKNMISGAAQADAAILVVDGLEGVREQTRRHAYMLSLLGLEQIAVVINKMDAVSYDQKKFNALSADIKKYLHSIGLKPSHIIPISARSGEMLASRSENLSWYKGKTLTEALDTFKIAKSESSNHLRFPVQDVYRYGEKRIVVGRIETGSLQLGDTLLFSPTNEEARVTSIEVWPADKNKKKASAGECIGITLDQPIFAERGHIASLTEDPPMLSNVLRASIFWLSKKPLKVGNIYKMRYGTHEALVNVQSIEKVINTQNLEHDNEAGQIEQNAVAEVTLRAHNLLPIDAYVSNSKLGRVVLYDGYDIAGGGKICMEGYPDQRVSTRPKSQNITIEDHLLSRETRVANKGHDAGIFWLTGLSGAGKSTIAMAVEKALFEKGFHSYVLDGDNLRHGLNVDLGFSPEDRTENIRRAGEVAALMSDAGLAVITSFISPYKSDRDRVRAIAPNRFYEIYIKADLATCEKRDPKGLYKKARAGKIAEFTGIGSPYEPPENPELVVDTQNNDIQECVDQVVQYIESCIGLTGVSAKEDKKDRTIAA